MFFDNDATAILLLEDGTYFEGLSINDCKRESRFLDSSISAEFILENFYDSALFNKAKMAK